MRGVLDAFRAELSLSHQLGADLRQNCLLGCKPLPAMRRLGSTKRVIRCYWAGYDKRQLAQVRGNRHRDLCTRARDASAVLAERLAAAPRESVVVMVGAGLSVNAGIPDFRTPGTGLYDNLQSYGLPYPEAVFDLDYFAQRPEPFYKLCRSLWPGQYQPTLAHKFIAKVHEKGLLRRCYTQNIDSLETQAGVPADRLVAAHGNFDTAHTVSVRPRPVPVERVREAVFDMDPADAATALREEFGALVKPGIVFFGEQLPVRFHELSATDFPKAELLIVVGTSLVVQPFASLVCQVRRGVPRALVNMERAGEGLSSGGFFAAPSDGFDFDTPGSTDVFLQGDCDAQLAEVAAALDWELD